MSAPPMKTYCPAPVTTTARTASSFSRASNATFSSSSVATESALAGGRLIVMTATPPATSTRMLEYVAVSLISLVLQEAAAALLAQRAGCDQFLQRRARLVVLAVLRVHGFEFL